MQHEVPEFKRCPNCGVLKAADLYYRNASRKDGLTYVCIECIVSYSEKEKKSKKILVDINKECCSCKRVLPARMYVYSQKTLDHLKDKCRTCSAFKGKQLPTITEIEEYESLTAELLRDGLSSYDMELNRSELEQYVWRGLVSAGLSLKWRPPVWVHKTSIPE